MNNDYKPQFEKEYQIMDITLKAVAFQGGVPVQTELNLTQRPEKFRRHSEGYPRRQQERRGSVPKPRHV